MALISPGGLRLLVGRNHRQNDWISFRQARRGDLWFHAQEQPGSHVVLKGSEQLASEADLQAAANLAAHFSRSRGNARVPVVMVPVEQPLQLLLVLLKMYGTDLYGLRVQFQQYINMLFWMPTTIRLPMAISMLVK